MESVPGSADTFVAIERLGWPSLGMKFPLPARWVETVSEAMTIGFQAQASRFFVSQGAWDTADADGFYGRASRLLLWSTGICHYRGTLGYGAVV